MSYKYDIEITEVNLDNQGEWDFTYNRFHTIYSDYPLSKEELTEEVKQLELDIESDTDDPYEDGYSIDDFEYTETIIEEE